MRIYCIRFKKNGKKYAYRTTSKRKIKRLKRKVSWYLIGSYDPTEL